MESVNYYIYYIKPLSIVKEHMLVREHIQLYKGTLKRGV
jgi:hypothetical protein